MSGRDNLGWELEGPVRSRNLHLASSRRLNKWALRERERQEVEREDALEAALRALERPAPIFAHDPERELEAFAGILERRGLEDSEYLPNVPPRARYEPSQTTVEALERRRRALRRRPPARALEPGSGGAWLTPATGFQVYAANKYRRREPTSIEAIFGYLVAVAFCQIIARRPEVVRALGDDAARTLRAVLGDAEL